MNAYEQLSVDASISELPSFVFQTIPGLMSNWFEYSKPGLGVWWWSWWWWWCNKGALIWWGVKIIVLWCCWMWCSPPNSIPVEACELLLWAIALLMLLLLPGELWCISFVFCSSESLHDSDDPFFTLPGFDPLCVFTCFAKWSDRMNRLLQTGQANLLNEIYWEHLLTSLALVISNWVPTFSRQCAF